MLSANSIAVSKELTLSVFHNQHAALGVVGDAVGSSLGVILAVVTDKCSPKHSPFS